MFAGERGQAGAGGERAGQREPAPGGRLGGWRRGRLCAQAGDRFGQQGGQVCGEVEVFEAVTVPVLLQRLRTGLQDVPQLGQQRPG